MASRPARKEGDGHQMLQVDDFRAVDKQENRPARLFALLDCQYFDFPLLQFHLQASLDRDVVHHRFRIGVLRTGAGALIRLAHATYFASPEVYALVGYPGPPEVPDVPPNVMPTHAVANAAT